jgi:hypothetical protein
MPLTRSQILQIDDLEREEVDVPEWGDTVVLRTLTGAERAKMVAGFLKASQADPDENLYYHLAIASMCNPNDGAQLFPDPIDVPVVIQKSGAALDHLVGPARQLNGYVSRLDQKKSSMIISNTSSGTFSAS